MRSKQRNYDSGSPCRSVRAYGPAGAVVRPNTRNPIPNTHTVLAVGTAG